MMESSSSAVGTVTAVELAVELTVDLERIMGLYRSLTEPGGLSLTAAATLAAIERFGPQRLTALAAREGVTQPAMTQLISRLEDADYKGHSLTMLKRIAAAVDKRVEIRFVSRKGNSMRGLGY